MTQDTPGHRSNPAHWEQRYVDNSIPWDTGRHDVHLPEVLETFGLRDGPAIDIGCGTGTNTIYLAQRGFAAVGVDVSRTAIDRAKQAVDAAKVDCTMQVVDLRTEDVPGGPFAFAYDRGCFHVFDDPSERQHFAERIAGVMQPGAIWHSLIGSTEGPPRDTGPPRRSAAMITAEVEPHFEILRLRDVAWDDGAMSHVRGWTLVARRRS